MTIFSKKRWSQLQRLISLAALQIVDRTSANPRSIGE